MTVITSNASGTSIVSVVSAGDIIYVAGSLVSNISATGNVLLNIYKTSDSSLLSGGTILNKEYAFSSGTSVTYSTVSGGLPYPSWAWTGSYDNTECFVKAIVSGASIIPVSDYEYFKINVTSSVPVISSQALNDYAITTLEQTTASCSVTNMTANDEVYLEINGIAWKMATTNNVAYTKTLNGNDIGACAAVTVKFVAKNTSGADEENAASTLTVTKATIDTQTKIADILLTLRDYLRANLTDPKSTTRTNSQWIYTSTPDLQTVQYPTITLYNSGMRAEPLGMSSLLEKNTVNILITVYSKSAKECDEISDDIIYWLKANRQVLVDDGLYNYIRTNTFDDKSDLDNKIRIKRIEVQYDYISV